MGNTQSKRHGFINMVRIEPGQTARLDVGVYESEMPQPCLHVQFEPDIHEDIGAALLRRDDKDEYILQYRLENFGDVTCTVTVRECDDTPTTPSENR